MKNNKSKSQNKTLKESWVPITPISLEDFNKTLRNQANEILFWHIAHNKNFLRKNLKTKLLSCDTCDKQFKIKNGLKSHYISEHTALKFNCPICKKSSGCFSALKSHYWYYHSKSWLYGEINSLNPKNMVNTYIVMYDVIIVLFVEIL